MNFLFARHLRRRLLIYAAYFNTDQIQSKDNSSRDDNSLFNNNNSNYYSNFFFSDTRVTVIEYHYDASD